MENLNLKRKNFKLLFFLSFFFLFSNFNYGERFSSIFKARIIKNLYGLEEKKIDIFPKIGLVLSGGGARGLAQIGVIRALEEEGIQFDLIVGTSMGSIVGGFYASGYSTDCLDSIVCKTDWQAFFSLENGERNDLFVEQKLVEDKALLTLRLDGLNPILPSSLNSGTGVSNFLNLLALNAPINNITDFNKLYCPFRAVSTDLVNGDKILLTEGTINRAMRASSSVTFLLPPVKFNGRLLVDGGLVSNIPVESARESGADYIIAVNTTSPLLNNDELNVPWNIADQVISIPMNILNKNSINEADFLIEPLSEKFKNDDFSKTSELVNTGYDFTKVLTKEIKNELIRKRISKIPEIFDTNYTFLFGDNLKEKLGSNNYSKKRILLNLIELINYGYLLDIEYFIHENNKSIIFKGINYPNIKSIKINNITLIKEETIEKIKSEIINKPYNPVLLKQTLLNLLRTYRKSGFSLATIDEVKFSEETGEVIIFINEGFIESIEVIGNTKTDESVILREFVPKIGDYLRFESIENALKSLTRTSFFDDVEISAVRKNGGYKVIISVIEKLTNNLRLGLKIDNEYFSQVNLDIREENFSGTGTEIAFLTTIGSKSKFFALEHKANRVLYSYLTYKVRAYFYSNDISIYRNKPQTNPSRLSREKFGEYRQNFFGASVSLGTQVQRFGNIIFEGKVEKNETRNLYEYFDADLNLLITSLKFNLQIDTQNKFPFPTSGFMVNSYLEIAQDYSAGNTGYSKLYFDYLNYFTIADWHTVKPHFIIGVADATLPLTQQFSFGGQNKFFGYRENEIRGRQIFISSLEYRYDLPFKLLFNSYIKVRYDLGSIWENKEEIRLKDLKHGIGFSYAIETPIGQADFSVGKSFVVNEAPASVPLTWGDTIFYFTIGHYY